MADLLSGRDGNPHYGTLPSIRCTSILPGIRGPRMAEGQGREPGTRRGFRGHFVSPFEDAGRLESGSTEKIATAQRTVLRMW
jgi:hypothetical protein